MLVVMVDDYNYIYAVAAYDDERMMDMVRDGYLYYDLHAVVIDYPSFVEHDGKILRGEE